MAYRHPEKIDERKLQENAKRLFNRLDYLAEYLRKLATCFESAALASDVRCYADAIDKLLDEIMVDEDEITKENKQ